MFIQKHTYKAYNNMENKAKHNSHKKEDIHLFPQSKSQLQSLCGKKKYLIQHSLESKKQEDFGVYKNFTQKAIQG